MRRRLLFLALWLLGVAGLWWGLPPTPQVRWSVPPGRLVLSFTGDGIAVTTDCEKFAAGTLEGWDVRTGKWLWAAPPVKPQQSVNFDTVNDRLLVNTDPMLTLDTRTGRPIKQTQPETNSLADPDNFYRHAVISPNGRFLITRSANHQRFEVWDIPTRRVIGEWPIPDDQRLPVAVTNDGRRVLGYAGELWDTSTGRDLRRQPSGPNRYTSGHHSFLTADGRWLVFAPPHKDVCPPGVYWFDVETGVEDVGRRWQPAHHVGTVMIRPELALYLWDPLVRGGLVVTTWQESPAGPIGRWFSEHLPGCKGLGEDRYVHRSWIVSAETGGTIAELPVEWSRCRRLSDGTGVLAVSVDNPDLDVVLVRGRTVAIWGLWPRPSLRLFAALAAGWAVVVVGMAWLTRRRAAPALGSAEPAPRG